MRKIQAIFAASAILLAGAGVLANARTAFAVTYYRAPDAQFNIPGALCGVVITPGCAEGAGPQCSHIYQTTVDGQTANRTYFISKIVDSGFCQIVTRPL